MQLPHIEPKYLECRFSTPAGNSAAIYLSDSPVNAAAVSMRYEVAAGKQLKLKLSDLSLLYAQGTANDVLDMITETDTMVSEEILKEVKELD